MHGRLTTRRGSTRLAALALGALTVAGLFCAGQTVGAQPQQPAAPQLTAKGPVGWDTFRDIGALPNLREGVRAKQFSSYDRTGGNDDGFEGTYSCLRKESKRCVIAEDNGPGEVGSIWFTYTPTTVAPTGIIRIELDGRTVLNAPLQDVVDGKLGAPFSWPLVGNNVDTMGGAVIKVPMPYRESMKITTQYNPHFYHVGYREFPDARGVRTFDPADPAADVLDRLRRYGVADPKPAVRGAATKRATLDLAAGAQSAPLRLTGPAQISQLRLRVPQATAAPNVLDDGRAYGSGGGSSFVMAIDPANEGVRLTRRYDQSVGNQRARVTVDGQPVGRWISGESVPDRWADQELRIPASLTAGKSKIRIQNTFVSADLDVNEFYYTTHSRVGDEWLRTDAFDLGPNNPQDEAAHDYENRIETFNGLKSIRYESDAADVARSDALLSKLRLRVSFDGKTTVDSPIGSFFGSGLGKYDMRSLMSSVDTTSGGAFTSWWPMPYAKNATVQLVNESNVPVRGGSVEVTSAPNASVVNGLAKGGALGYFNATHNRADTVAGKDWNFLTAKGRGVSYGVTHTMRPLDQGEFNQLNYLEGDERIYVDGAKEPAWHGTGTEDFYESGWYFMDVEAGRLEGVPYDMPLAGAVGNEVKEPGCVGKCLGAYRFLLADAVSFDSALRFDIEHGPANDRPANYESTAFWYRGN